METTGGASSLGRVVEPTTTSFSAGNAGGSDLTRVAISTSLSGAASQEEHNNNNNNNNKRAYRPGRNSYLKVVLDDDTLDYLHDCSLQLEKKVQTMAQQQQQQQDANKKVNHSNKKKTLTFRPRSRESLHLTLFFAGEELCELPPDELCHWHAALATRLERSNFCLKTTASSNNINNDKRTMDDTHQHDEFQLSIRELSLFPPRRNYLVVALLEPTTDNDDDSWQALYSDLRQMALQGDSDLLASVVQRTSKTKWIPHITLGNLLYGRAGKRTNNNKEEEENVKTMLLATTTMLDDVCHTTQVKGISMGGPTPMQAGPLDWDFYRSTP